MMLERLMADFAERNQLGAIDRSREGLYSLTFDERLVVNIEQFDEENAIVLSGLVGSAEDIGAELLREFLASNLELKRNGGAAVGLDPDRNELMLTLFIDAVTINVDEFGRKLTRYVDHFEALHQLVETAEELGGDVETRRGEQAGEDFILLRV